MAPKKKAKARAQPKPVETEAKLINPDTVFDNFFDLNVCRLCQRENGPFLNLFDDGNITVRKIEELMPFKVPNYEKLPSKICFRCSAKVEEFYDFVKTCTRIQNNLLAALGEVQPGIKKAKTQRTIWEEQLHKSNITNDVICDALVKKAMGFISDIPLPKIELNRIDSANTTNTFKSPDNDSKSNLNNNHDNHINPKKPKVVDAKKTVDAKKVADAKKAVDAKNTAEAKKALDAKKAVEAKKVADAKKAAEAKKEADAKKAAEAKKEADAKKAVAVRAAKNDEAKTDEPILIDDDDTTLSSDLVDRVNIIKVNGFGILFQCKSCNRNFLKKSIISKHICPADNTPNKTVPETKPSEIHKPPNVKYINTAEEKLVQAQSTPVPSTSTHKKKLIGPASRIQALKSAASSGAADSDTVDKKSRKRSAAESFLEPSHLQPISMFGANVSRQQEQAFVPNANQPYPVGLFKSHLQDKPPTIDKKEHVIFSTTALDKQTYSVVKTTTPGKILISSKPRVTSANANGAESSLTGNSAKRDSNITFIPYINDPHLQPSYVIPEDSPQAESRRLGRTYGGAQNYECEICHEKFGREGKWFAHMKKHYLQS